MPFLIQLDDIVRVDLEMVMLKHLTYLFNISALLHSVFPALPQFRVEWTLDPWLECSHLLTRAPQTSLTDSTSRSAGVLASLSGPSRTSSHRFFQCCRIHFFLLPFLEMVETSLLLLVNYTPQNWWYPAWLFFLDRRWCTVRLFMEYWGHSILCFIVLDWHCHVLCLLV